MKPTKLGSDPVEDITPKSVFGKNTQRLAYLLITFIGFFFVVFAVYDRLRSGLSWVPELFISLGVAIAAPAILSYLYRRYMLEDIKTELEQPALEFKERAIKMVEEATTEVVDQFEQQVKVTERETQQLISGYQQEIALLNCVNQAGVCGVYSTRRDALANFSQYIVEEPYAIMVIGSSLLGLLQEPDREYEEIRENLLQRKDSGVKLRFLLTHPQVADLRAQQENRRPKDIGKEIIKSLRILIDDWRIPRENVKLYQGTPTCFGIKSGRAMLLNFYPYMKEAYVSPCLIVLKGGYFYDQFNESHFKAWTSEMAQATPNNLSELEEQLDGYAKQVKLLMDL